MAGRGATSRGSPKEENNLKKTYLVAYNVSQMLGWTAIMFAMVSHVVSARTNVGIYKSVEPLLRIFQTAAVLEVLHVAFGIVRSNIVLTAFQVASRVFLLWGVLITCPYVQDNVVADIFLFCWTLTEIIRYSYYLFNLIGEVPYAISWCRYTFFIILYPLGVTGELLTLFGTLPYVEKLNIYSFTLPNVFNIAFNYKYFLMFVMLLYIPTFPSLYNHMLIQRKKVLGGGEKKRSKRD